MVEGIWVAGTFFVVALAGILAWLVILRKAQDKRVVMARAVYPQSIVLECARMPAVAATLDSSARDFGWNGRTGDVPLWFVAVVDADGFRVLNFEGTVVARAPIQSLTGCAVDMIWDGRKSVRGLRFTFSFSSGPVALEVPILGAGIGRAYSLREPEMQVLASKVVALLGSR